MELFSEEQVLQYAKEAYRSGDAKFAIKKDKCALLVIDMQDEFVQPHSTPYWIPEATRQVPLIKKLIAACRHHAIPVIFTVFSRTNSYLDRPASGKFMPNRFPDMDIDQSGYFIKGNVWKELKPQKDDLVIHKPSYGAFYDTPLETILKNLNRDTIIICGTMTNFCCGTTARQGYERGFKVVFGSDVTSTDDMTMQEPELKVLRKGFARVLSAEQIVNALNDTNQTNEE
jgi:nicotinamidase-related amidase